MIHKILRVKLKGAITKMILTLDGVFTLSIVSLCRSHKLCKQRRVVLTDLLRNSVDGLEVAF